jgi:hypothetical protein
MHSRLSDNTAELIALLPRLEEELPEKKRNPYGGFGSGSGGHHPLAAWNVQAAMLILDVHVGARELECNLRYQIAGTIWVRGGSEGNTERCLKGLPSLAMGVPYDVQVTALRRMESWIYRGRLVLGDAEPVSRLPRLPGESEPRCPYGEHKGTLRVRHTTGVVTCLHPACRDGNGQKPVGRIELGVYSGEPLIAWADGTTGVAA